MSQNSYKLPKKKIAVVAKFDWYLEDTIHTFLNTQIEVTTFRSLRELSVGLENNSNFDFIFFPHVSEIIPKEIYGNFLCIGFHTGDLPADRGGSPIQNKILTKKYITNVSAFRITEEIDGGPIYSQHVIDLSEGTIVDILHNLSKICAKMIFNIVINPPTPIYQNGEVEVKVRRKPIDSLLPQNSVGLRSLYDRIRMVDGLDYPRAFIKWGDNLVEFTSAKIEDGKLTASCEIREQN